MAKNSQSQSLIWFGVAAIAILVAGTGAAWLMVQSLQSRSSQVTISSPSNPSQTSPQNAISGQAQVSWLSVQNNQTKWVMTAIAPSQSLDQNQLLQTALEQLLTQNPVAPLSSAIPQGTRLLSLTSDAQGIHLNLSQQFTQGGGSESMRGRLGQIIYTATSLNPQAPVWISVEGKPLESLGGEGLMIAQPINRQLFEDDFNSDTP